MWASRCRTVEPGGPAGSSRSTVALLDGHERRESCRRLRHRCPPIDVLRGPVPPTPSRTTRGRMRGPTVDLTSASTGDTRAWSAHPGHAPTERGRVLAAVVAGHHVHVSGTAPIPAGGDPPESLRADAAVPRDRAERARQAGACRGRRRTRIYRAGHGLGRSDGTRRGFRQGPTGDDRCVVAELLDPRWRSRSRRRRDGSRSTRIRSPARARRGRQRPRPQVRAVRSVHARRRGGVHAPRRRDASTSSSTSTRCCRAITGHELEPRINAELMQSVLEIATPVCRNAGDVQRELLKLRAYVTGIARQTGLRVGSAGTHPFSLFERQRITARDRYRNLVDQLQYVARRELIFGMHVHVAVDDPEKAIQVVNGLLPQLGPLLALSASSRLLARRADRALLEPPDGLRRLPALRARRRASATTRITPRSSASSSAPAASPTTRTSGGTSGCTRGSARSRSGSATRSPASRTRSRSRRTARRSSSCSRSSTTAASRSPRSTASSRPRTSGSPRATGSRRR